MSALRTDNINDWKTRIDESWWDDVTGPILFSDIECGNNSRVKGGVFSGDMEGCSHLKKVTQTIRNRMENNLDPLEVPIAIEDNPNFPLTSDKRFRLVLGHHRIRGLMDNGFEAFDMVHIHGAVTKDDHLRLRFQIFNNDHDQASVSNSDPDIKGMIDAEFRKLMDGDYTLVDHKKIMRKKVRALMRDLVGFGKTESQTDLMVEKWIEEQEMNPAAGHQTKFKAYSNAGAKQAAMNILGLNDLKLDDSKKQCYSNSNTILYVTNVNDAGAPRSFQYAWTSRLHNPKKKIIIAAYFKTTTLNAASDLQYKRFRTAAQWLDLKARDKKRCGPIGYRPPADNIIFLPQCVDPADFPEDEDKPIIGPW